jgi:hypothetical protein
MINMSILFYRYASYQVFFTNSSFFFSDIYIYICILNQPITVFQLLIILMTITSEIAASLKYLFLKFETTSPCYLSTIIFNCILQMVTNYVYNIPSVFLKHTLCSIAYLYYYIFTKRTLILSIVPSIYSQLHKT